MANFQDTSKTQSDASKLSFQLVLRWLSSVRYFGALTVKCSLTNITTENMANLQILSYASKESFLASFTVFIIRVTFWSSYGEMLTFVTPKMANLQYTVTRIFSQSYGAYHKRDTLELLR